MDMIVMWYWMSGQVMNMMSSVMYRSNLRMGRKIIRRVLMMTHKVLLRDHLRSSKIIAILGSVRSRVGGLGDAL